MEGSTNPVQSGGVKMALDSKQDIISDLPTIRSGAAAGATAYQKPSGGIPKTDLTSGVQTSLGKADTAFQKPSGGIPASDLSTAVQTSLGKADTAVSLFVEVSIEEWPQWVQPQGAQDAYMIGDKVTFEGVHYVSLIDNNVWSPAALPSGWEARL